MSSQPQPSAVQHLQLLSIRAFTFGFLVPGKTTTACLAAACFVGISSILLGEVASSLYFPFSSSTGAEWGQKHRNVSCGDPECLQPVLSPTVGLIQAVKRTVLACPSCPGPSAWYSRTVVSAKYYNKSDIDYISQFLERKLPWLRFLTIVVAKHTKLS